MYGFNAHPSADGQFFWSGYIGDAERWCRIEHVTRVQDAAPLEFVNLAPCTMWDRCFRGLEAGPNPDGLYRIDLYRPAPANRSGGECLTLGLEIDGNTLPLLLPEGFDAERTRPLGGAQRLDRRVRSAPAP